MSAPREHFLKLLEATGYSLPLNPGTVNIVESPLISWFVQNISLENCITEEELTEFQSLQDSGKALYSEELEEALQKYNDAGALVPVDSMLEDVKRNEVEHADHQLNVQKQIVSLLRSELYFVEEDCRIQDQQCRDLEEQLSNVLKLLLDANTKFIRKLDHSKDTYDALMKNIMEMAPKQEPSTDEGIHTYSSDRLNSSTFSNFSVLSSASCNKVKTNDKYIFQMSLDKYNKLNSKFCKLLKDVLLKRLSKIQVREDSQHNQLLIQNIMHRLFRQKMKLIELTAELAGINGARNKIKELKSEIKNNLWKPTQSNLSCKLTELEDCSLNDSEASVTDIEDETLSVGCRKWAELKVLKPICQAANERMESDQLVLKKLDQLVSIMLTRLSINIHLCNKMYWERDVVENTVEAYRNIHGWLERKADSAQSRLTIMNENLQDYQDHYVNAQGKFVECLTAVLDCNESDIPSAYDRLMDVSHGYHKDFVESCHQKIQTLTSVNKSLRELYLEEEEKKQKNRESLSVSNQEHFNSISQTLDDIVNNIDEAKLHCYTLLENNKVKNA